MRGQIATNVHTQLYYYLFLRGQIAFSLILSFLLCKCLFIDTVSMNKKYRVDTVSTNKKYRVDTVSTNKKYRVDTLSCKILTLLKFF